MEQIKKNQSSVEWLFQQVWINPVSKLPEILEQAKAMHEKELFETFKAGQDSMEEGGKNFEQYYNSIFGGDNE